MVLLWVGCDGCLVGVINNEVTFSLCNMLHACWGELVLEALEGKAPNAGDGTTTRTCNAPVENKLLV